MSYPYGPTTFDALTTGATIGAAAWGSDAKTGGGAVTVAVPGLFSSAKCANLVCTANNVTYSSAVTGTRHWVAFDFQVPAGPPDEAGPAVTSLIRCLDGSSDVMARVYFDLDGALKVRDDGATDVGDSGFTYCGSFSGDNDDPVYTPGAEYHLLYRIDTAVGKQKLWIWNAGHYKEVGPDGLAIGPNAIASIEITVGGDVSATFEINLDNVLLTNVEQTVPDPVFVQYVIPGNVRSDGVDLCVASAGYESHRARIFASGSTDSILTTDAVAVSGSGRVSATAGGLSAATSYDYAVDGFRNDAWVADLVTGSFKTAPRAKYPAASGLFMMTGCEFASGIGLPKDTTWDPAIARGYDAFWQGGDLQYENVKTLAAGPFRQAIEAQLADRPAMAEFFAKTTALGYNPSDHDGGGGQAAAVQDPSTEYAIVAWGDSWPHAEPWHDGLCRSTSVTWGRTRFVMPDFRTLARSDSGDPDTDAKLAYSAEDEAQIIAELEDDEHALVVLCFDQPWPGQAADVVPKDDHMANYPNQRARINAAIASRLARGLGVFIVQADYHGLVWRNPGTAIDDTTGGAGLIGIAGSWNNTGNIRPNDWGNYTGFWGEEQSPDPEFDIAVSGELEITDDGLTITITGRCLDNDNAVVRATVTDSWDVEFTIPQAQKPSYDLGFLPLTDEFGRFSLLQGTEIPSVSSKSGSVRQPMKSHGRVISDVFLDGGQVLLRVKVTDLDATGTPGGRLQRDANIDTLKSVAGSNFRQTLGYRPEWDQPVTREAEGYVLASVPVEPFPTFAIATIVVDLEGSFRSTTLSTFELDMSDGDRPQERITPLEGTTAPITSPAFRMSGGFSQFRVMDHETEQWLKITADPPVDTDQAVVVDGWSAWLVDEADGWDVTGGDDVSNWLDSSSTGETPLVLYPHADHDDPFTRVVTIDVNIGDETGSPLFQVRAKAGYH